MGLTLYISTKANVVGLVLRMIAVCVGAMTIYHHIHHFNLRLGPLSEERNLYFNTNAPMKSTIKAIPPISLRKPIFVGLQTRLVLEMTITKLPYSQTDNTFSISSSTTFSGNPILSPNLDGELVIGYR